MSEAAELLHRSVRRVLLGQAALVVLVAAGFLLWPGRTPGLNGALAAIYGGSVAILSAWWLGRQVRRAGSGGAAQSDTQRSQIALYAGAGERFLVTLALLGLGLGWLKLMPLPVIIAFGVAQAAFLINFRGAPRPSN